MSNLLLYDENGEVWIEGGEKTVFTYFHDVECGGYEIILREARLVDQNIFSCWELIPPSGIVTQSHCKVQGKGIVYLPPNIAIGRIHNFIFWTGEPFSPVFNPDWTSVKGLEHYRQYCESPDQINEDWKTLIQKRQDEQREQERRAQEERNNEAGYILFGIGMIPVVLGLIMWKYVF